MFDDNDNSIVPIRTRGPIRRTARHTGAEPVKGAIRTRGAVRAGGEAMASGMSLGQLVQELREDVGGFPLTFVVHDAHEPAADDFISALAPDLQPDDAVWLVPARSVSPSPRRDDGAVTLDRGNDTDARIYGNLVAELVFFPARDADETEALRTWTSRVRAALIDVRGPERNALLRVARDAGAMAYEWDGSGSVTPR